MAMIKDKKELDKLEKDLLRRDITINAIQNSKLNKILNEDNIKLIENFTDANKNKNLYLIVELEKSILEHTLEKYGNSKAMKSSLSTAILELNIIQKHIKKVDDIEEYKHIDNSFKNPKNRQKNLPIDEAVQGFKGHIARLSNLDKANLSDDEKNLIKARIEAFKTAYNIYQQKQAKTLAVDL